MRPLAWRSIESLCNIVYVLAATALWRTVDVVVWDVHGPGRYLMWGGLAASWLFYWYLHLVEYDCGLAFGSTTLVARGAATTQPQLENWTVGTRRWIRFPVHTAFFGMFLLFPTMTADLLVLGIVANAYNVLGSVLYDRRLIVTVPAQWKPYMERTGLIWPPVYRAPAGAREWPWPKPRHWRRPVMHLPGLVVGALLGYGYFIVLGSSPWGPADMALVLFAGVAASLVGGVLLGVVCRPDSPDWGQRQTDLSTTVALSSAVAVVVWISIAYLSSGRVPTLGTYLPLWFTVQYLGHVVAYLTAPRKWQTREMLDTKAPQEQELVR